MVNIRVRLAGLMLSKKSSSSINRDREEIIDVTDMEEDVDEDDDEDEDDDGTTDAADEDEDEEDDNVDDDDDDLDELERMHTATEAIPFSYCHRSVANHHHRRGGCHHDDVVVDNELFSTGDALLDCCGPAANNGTTPATMLMPSSYQRLNNGHHATNDAAPSATAPTSASHTAEPASQRIRRYAQLSGRMLFLCCATFAVLITFAVYMEQLSASNALLNTLQAAATAAIQEREQQQASHHPAHLLREPAAAAAAAADDGVDDNNDDGVDYAYDESPVVMVRLNGLGALLFVNGVVFYGLCGATAVAAWLGQWWRRDGIQLLQFPLPIERLLSVATVTGIAGAGIFICSYQRVVCHLQDPLKGFCLAFGIVFYFLCCKKVMGLQKIFAAMTAVVGLLIAVDYGLCDSFRCRGVDVPFAEATTATVPRAGRAQQQQLPAGFMTTMPTTGWQSRAVWTMGYIGALALWSLQWALIEADVVTTFQTAPQKTPKARHHLLATVSRLVDQDRHHNADIAHMSANQKVPKSRTNSATKSRKPKAILLAAWLHGMASLATFLTGLVDIVPATGPPASFDQFVYNTYGTLMCHGNLCRHAKFPVPGVWLHPTTHQQHNDTHNAYATRLNRQRRSSMDLKSTIPTTMTTPLATPTTMSNKRLADGRLHELVINGTVHLVAVTDRHHHSAPGGNSNTSNGSSSAVNANPIAPATNNNGTMTSRKINSERYWKRYKERYVKRKKLAALSSTSTTSFSASSSASNSESFSASSSSSPPPPPSLASPNVPSAADASSRQPPNNNRTTKGRPTADALAAANTTTTSSITTSITGTTASSHHTATAALYIDGVTVSDFTLNWPIMRTALLFSLAYAVLLVCTVQFLLDTESAVFTVAVQSLALPLAGLFWSMFELTTDEDHIATIIWAPEITGELICSVLGTPIVVLGLCLFGAAHLEDVALKQRMHDAVTS